MNLLAIDTSASATWVVARRADGTLAARRHDPSGTERPAHTTLGLVLAAEVLAELELDWQALDRIGVGTGPGSFTGLRSGLSAAAGLARRLEIPLVGFTTPQVLAASATPRPLLAVVDGRRRELFVERFTGAAPGGGLQVVRRDAVAELGDLTGWLAIGDGALLEAEALAALGAQVPAADSELHRGTPQAVAELVAAGEPQQADDVRPTYGREADAVPTAQREGRSA